MQIADLAHNGKSQPAARTFISKDSEKTLEDSVFQLIRNTWSIILYFKHSFVSFL